MGTEFVGNHLSRGTKYLGTICPWGLNLMGTVYPGGSILWGTGSPGIKWVRDQIRHNSGFFVCITVNFIIQELKFCKTTLGFFVSFSG